MTRWLLLCWVWIYVPVSEAAGLPCQVRLLNGDRLIATYIGQEGEESVFESHWQADPIRIHGKFIDTIDFGLKSPALAGDRLIVFDSDQWIRGRILTMNDGQLQLQTSWQKPLHVDMGYVKKIERTIPAEDIIYQSAIEREDMRFADFLSSPYGWQLPVGESRLNLPRVEGSFVLRLIFQIPELPLRDLSALRVGGFPRRRDVRGPDERTLRFMFDEYGVGVEQQGPLFLQGGFLVNQQQSASLQISGRRALVMTVEYDEPENITRAKVNGQILFEREEGRLENLNPISDPALSFFSKSSSQEFLLTDLLFYRFHPVVQGRGAEMSTGKERFHFANGDVFQAAWEGVDTEGNWLLKNDTLAQVTPMDPARIFAWTAGETARKNLRRKAQHVQLQLAGGAGRFLAEFVKADATHFTFRREGWQGEFSIPFSQIERLRFNPYFR